MTAVGETLGGKYRFERLLGEGGMGAVYAAENLNTGRRVAVKVLRGEWTQQPEVVQRFLREARATTTIAHPNVVEVLDLDVDRERGIPYIVQEFLEGETLEAERREKVSPGSQNGACQPAAPRRDTADFRRSAAAQGEETWGPCWFGWRFSRR
jgi:serine/threonine protein kinase